MSELINNTLNEKDHIKTLYDELNRGTQERHNLKEKNFELENTICSLLVIKEEHQKEIESLKAELAKERSVVDFYADKDNWSLVNQWMQTRINSSDEQVPNEQIAQISIRLGGKLARQRQRERK